MLNYFFVRKIIQNVFFRWLNKVVIYKLDCAMLFSIEYAKFNFLLYHINFINVQKLEIVNILV